MRRQRQLTLAKAREVPALLTHSAALAWERRWTRMLGTACAVAFAESLVEPSERETRCQMGGDTSSLAELLSHEPRKLAVTTCNFFFYCCFQFSVKKKVSIWFHVKLEEELCRRNPGSFPKGFIGNRKTA